MDVRVRSILLLMQLLLFMKHYLMNGIKQDMEQF